MISSVAFHAVYHCPILARGCGIFHQSLIVYTRGCRIRLWECLSFYRQNMASGKKSDHHLLHSSASTSPCYEYRSLRFYDTMGFIKAVENYRENVCTCQINIDEELVIKQKGY
ncbi:hypothetical protein AVEN_73911-1 [Araneus ventricosus]|uniref:Uncharacterized protein n=1 Tax=Araneus ventricosus TaxID=182803 RepID=A0A4Y2SQV8_ARAVE|nr:hypothetical protein AVEN_73911-1 [Araneus ventricosus]